MTNKILTFFYKYQIPILILIILVIIGGVFYPRVKNIGMKYYLDEGAGISFYYPKNWSILSKNDIITYNPNAQIGLIKTNSQDSSFGIKIQDQSGKTNFKIKESLDNLKKSLEKKLDDLSILEEKDTTFLNAPAIDITYNFSAPIDDKGSKFRGTQRQILFLYNEKLYTLMFNSLPQDFQRDNKDFNIILQSFKLN